MVTQLRGHFFLPRVHHHYQQPTASHLDLHSPGERPLSPQASESARSHSPIVSTFSAFLLQIKVLLISLLRALLPSTPPPFLPSLCSPSVPTTKLAWVQSGQRAHSGGWVKAQVGRMQPATRPGPRDPPEQRNKHTANPVIRCAARWPVKKKKHLLALTTAGLCLTCVQIGVKTRRAGQQRVIHT